MRMRKLESEAGRLKMEKGGLKALGIKRLAKSRLPGGLGESRSAICEDLEGPRVSRPAN